MDVCWYLNVSCAMVIQTHTSMKGKVNVVKLFTISFRCDNVLKAGLEKVSERTGRKMGDVIRRCVLKAYKEVIAEIEAEDEAMRKISE